MGGYVSPPPDPRFGLPVDRKAEEVYTNIKALTGVPYGEVIPGMQVMSEALGVDCEHCHSASGDRDLEGNPNKDVARQMIRMVRELNQSSFGGRNVISCFTCHRGQVQPSGTLAFGGSPDSPPPTRSLSPESLPATAQIIERFIQAMGGEGLVIRFARSRVETGTVTIISSGDSTHRIRIMSSSPDKRRTDGFSVSHLGNSEQAFGIVTEDQGWMRESNGPVRLMFGWRRDAAQLEDIFNLPRRLRQMQEQLRVSRSEFVNGRRAIVLSGSTEHLPLFEYSFDEQSGLLVRLEYFVDSVVGRMPSRIDYSDYRGVAASGKVPFHWEVTLVRGVRVAYQLDSVQPNVPLRFEAFELPNPPPSLYR